MAEWYIEQMALNNKTRTIKIKMFRIIKINKEDKFGKIMAGKDRMEDTKSKEDQHRMTSIETVDPEMKEIVIEYIYTTYLNHFH